MYIKITSNFSRSLSKHNVKKALIAIGKADPMAVKRFYLSKKEQYVRFGHNDGEVAEKEYLRRGILNVRKKINGNLGKDGKFKNNMIIRMLFKNSTNLRNHEIIHINSERYISIVRTICVLLYNINPQLAEELLSTAQSDETVAGLMHTPRGRCFKTVAPAHTNAIITGIYDGSHKREADNLVKRIMEIIGHVEPSK